MTSLPILSLQVTVTPSSDLTTDQAISQLNDKVKLIIENIVQLRHQLNDIVSIYTQKKSSITETAINKSNNSRLSTISHSWFL
jgi:prefoldin subunit 5